jgi:hypothetical protein
MYNFFIYSLIYLFILSLIYTFIIYLVFHLFIHSFMYLCIRLFIYFSLIYSFVHLYIYLFVHSLFIYLFIYSFVHLLMYSVTYLNVFVCLYIFIHPPARTNGSYDNSAIHPFNSSLPVSLAFRRQRWSSASHQMVLAHHKVYSQNGEIMLYDRNFSQGNHV